MMPLFALVVDSITTGVQVASLSHGIVSVRVIHFYEIIETFILLLLRRLSYCNSLHWLSWLLIVSSVAILFKMIANVQHWPAGNRINRFSDWLRYLDIAMVHPIGTDGWCLILLLYQRHMVQSSSAVIY